MFDFLIVCITPLECGLTVSRLIKLGISKRFPGRFGPGSFRPGSIRPGSFRPNLGVGRFGLGRWVDSALGRFGPGSFRPKSIQKCRLLRTGRQTNL